MNVTLQPRHLSGTIPAIASKSCAHRLLICAALADGETVIACKETNQDIDATVQCLRSMGAGITREHGCFRVKPIRPTALALPDCGESGSTLRFLLPVLCALGQAAEITMHGRLPERPLEPLWSELCRHGAILGHKSREVLTVNGKLQGNGFTLAANISSQYISGLMFALPLLGGGTIRLTGELESAGYVTMTQNALETFGIQVQRGNDCITVLPGSYRSPGEAVVEGDWSNGAFWITADFLSAKKVECTGLNPCSSQGDRNIIEALAAIRTGCAVIDAGQIPDLVPILSVAASLTPGTTRIIHAERLRLKESDRLQTVTDLLTDLGGMVTQTADGLEIYGKNVLRGGRTHSRNDHRIAMAAAIASIGCQEPVTIEQAEAVKKSYPGFYSDFVALGGCLTWEE